jgi:hypothetical protein
MRYSAAIAIAFSVGAVSCAKSASTPEYRMPSSAASDPSYVTSEPPPLDPNRKIAEQDCSKPIELDKGNIRCK